jgi:hypothetical protein
VLKSIWKSLFGSKEINLNVSIEIKDLDKIVGVLSSLPVRSFVENNENNSKNIGRNTNQSNIISKKETLKDDPISASDIASLMKDTGIEKGIDKTGDICSQSNGSSTDDMVSSLKRFKGKG